MRRIIGAAAAAAFLAVAAAAPAAAAPRPPCTGECVVVSAQPTASPAWAGAEWNTNPQIHYVRGVAHCAAGRNEILYTGGWVTSVDLWSKAHCTNAYPALIGGAYDAKNCATCSSTRHWFWGHLKQP